MCWIPKYTEGGTALRLLLVKDQEIEYRDEHGNRVPTGEIYDPPPPGGPTYPIYYGGCALSPSNTFRSQYYGSYNDDGKNDDVWSSECDFGIVTNINAKDGVHFPASPEYIITGNPYYPQYSDTYSDCLRSGRYITWVTENVSPETVVNKCLQQIVYRVLDPNILWWGSYVASVVGIFYYLPYIGVRPEGVYYPGDNNPGDAAECGWSSAAMPSGDKEAWDMMNGPQSTLSYPSAQTIPPALDRQDGYYDP